MIHTSSLRKNGSPNLWEYSYIASLVTTREKEILIHIASGNTSGEIAEKLFISEHTVTSHRKNLIGKLGVRNTAHLVMKGVMLGLL